MPAAMPVYLRPRPRQHKMLWRHAAGTYGAWTLVLLLLTPGGNIAWLEGYRAAWILHRVNDIGLAAVYGVGASAIVAVLLGARTIALNILGGFVFLTAFGLWTLFKGSAHGNDLIDQVVLVTVLIPTIIAFFSVAFPTLPTMRPREARQVGVVLLLFALAWVAAVRTGVLNSVWSTGNVDLVVFLPVVLACLGVAGPVGVLRTRIVPAAQARQETVTVVSAPSARGPSWREEGRSASPQEATADASPTTRAAQTRSVAPLRLEDIVLPAKTRDAILALIRLLQDPNTGSGLMRELPRGALLHGPSGNGKTMIARAIATETGRHYVALDAGNTATALAGQTAAWIAAAFEEARAHALSIVFIDELDAIGASRRKVGSHGGEAAHEHRRAVGALLAAIQGVSGPGGVFTIGATNHPDALDPAIRNRLSYSIYVGPPNLGGRAEILHRSWPERVRGIDPLTIALWLEQDEPSGRETHDILIHAGLHAMSRKSDAVETEDVQYALQRMREMRRGIRAANVLGDEE